MLRSTFSLARHASMTGARLDALKQGVSPPTSRITLTIRAVVVIGQGREVEVRGSVRGEKWLVTAALSTADGKSTRPRNVVV
ncbi:MAG: hypothetical protein KF716_12255 [Anaerolineae bacterium]|nr:hypothetical protein [Anaerolineae bacterium]